MHVKCPMCGFVFEAPEGKAAEEKTYPETEIKPPEDLFDV